MTLALASIADIAMRYRDGSLSPVEVTAACLERVRLHDGALKAFITVTDDLAMTAARRAERELADGLDRGLLHGIPIAIKDLIDTAGIRTTGGSEVWLDNVPAGDAPLWSALQAAGAVLVGKTNLQEFAHGVPHPRFGQTRNPWDLARTAGGSSGGSAAAVMAGMCFAAVGTDTGGSIRVPASYCGAVGLKPTYGAVNTDGVFPLSWSLDHAGPMARTARDAAALFAGMTGGGYGLPDVRLDGLRLGVIGSHAEGPELTPEASASFAAACSLLSDAGADLVTVEVRDLELSEGLLPTIVGPEAAVAHQDWLESDATAGYSDDTRRQLWFGFEVSGVQYVRAQQFRRHLAARFIEALDGLDALLSPTVAWAAPAEDPSIMSDDGESEGRRTVPYNLVGLPALSIPSAAGGDGMPFGLQLAGRPHDDRRLLAIGAAAQDAGLGVTGVEPTALISDS